MRCVAPVAGRLLDWLVICSRWVPNQLWILARFFQAYSPPAASSATHALLLFAAFIIKLLRGRPLDWNDQRIHYVAPDSMCRAVLERKYCRMHTMKAELPFRSA